MRLNGPPFFDRPIPANPAASAFAPAPASTVMPPLLRRLRPLGLRAAAVVAGALVPGCVPQETGVTRLRVAVWMPPGLTEEVCRRFEAAHPGVEIDLLVTGGRYAEKLQSMIIAGNEPDVLMGHDTFYHDWAARGVFLDLTEFVAGLHAEDPFLPGPLEMFRYRGRHYVVPADTNALVSFGNLDVLAAAGVAFPWPAVTWEQFEDLGPRFSRRDHPGSPTEYLCAMPPPNLFLIAYGAAGFDDPHHPRAVVVNSPRTHSAVEYWRRVHARGWAAPRSTVQDQGEAEMFRDGRIAFLFWGRGVSRIIRMNPDRRFDIAPLPSPEPNAPVPHLSVGMGISRRSRHVALAKQFLRFYTSDAGNEAPIAVGQIVPVRRRQAYGEQFLSQHPPASTRHFVEPMEAGRLTALVSAPGRLAAEELVRRRFEQALAEPQVPTAEIVAALEADLRDWLERLQRKGLW